MPNTPKLRLFRTTPPPPMTVERLLAEVKAQTTTPPAPLMGLISTIPEVLPLVIETFLDNFDYNKNLENNLAVYCRMLAAITVGIEAHLKEISKC